jgi:hypothetical protein
MPPGRRSPLSAWTFALLWALALPHGAAAQTPTPTDTGFANYAFASELGSGIYEIDGRTIEVYQLPFNYLWRAPAQHGGRPGIRLILPLTVGFFNFQPSDLEHLRIPTQIGAVSFEPGVELDYWLSDAWHVYPYAKAGATFASSTRINALIYGIGVRSDYRFDTLESDGLWRAELLHAGVSYGSDLPNDAFTRLRDGVELRRNLPWPVHGREPQIAPYAVTDIYFDAPSGPESGISARTVQFEAGLMFGVSPMWQVHGIPLPRLGVGYRVAGVLSGWRLVIGDPF